VSDEIPDWLIAEAIRELLLPNGEPLGEQGRRWDVRVAEGGLPAAEALMDELMALGDPAHSPNYPGRMVVIPGQGEIGLRPISGSGEPTIDVRVKCVSGIRKIKFE
jgi:hypothetical protein